MASRIADSLDVGDRRLDHRIVKLLDLDPDLGENLSAERLATARRHIRAATIEIPRGRWSNQPWPAHVRSGPGLLVLDGLLVRRIHLDGRFGAELLGRGDMLRPWQHEDAVASVLRSSDWRVLQGARLAVLDLEFARRIAPYPEVVGALVGRTLRRARSLAVTIAILNQPKIERRLLVLLWHIADRWGTTRPGGILLPTRLPHSVLAEALAARRPTVTTALTGLQDAGLVSQVDDGWVLHGAPPSELRDIIANDTTANGTPPDR